ncbi:MAG: phage tail tape measure protein, partial [Methanosarcina barkeri]|nr:phage tail tape measure protein [Methanosarcina sp. ERenArc_MAG2]
MFRLFGSILINNDGANEAIDETEQRAQKTTKTFGEMVGAAVQVGAGIAAGLGVALTALGGLLASTSENAKMIDKFSQVTGFSTEGFQKWDYVMKGVGYSMEQASGDMAALAEKAMEAASGAGESADMFKMLGVSVLDSNGKLKSQEQLFNESIKGLQGMEDITKRNAIATALFSTTGEELG